MVTVTESAKAELKRRLEVHSLTADKYLRLATSPMWVGGGDFGIVIDERKEGDQVVDFQGSEVLLVDASLADRLSDSVFDFKDSRFTLDVY